MWPFSLGPPKGSPLRRGQLVRLVETGGCDGGIRRSVKVGTVTGFVNAAEKWPNSNFDKKDPFSIFAEIKTIDAKEAFLSHLKGVHTVTFECLPASRNYWHMHTDGVWEYEV